MSMERRATEVARRRYNRIAAVYDLMESVVENSRYNRWRQALWSKVEGKDILEVGVGTGKNFPYYPENTDVTAIDFSEKMLSRARKKAQKQELKVHLFQMDVQNLEFENNTFDTVVSSFVFCSVPGPARGLMEVERRCRPGGKVVRIIGANINRRAV